MNRRERKRLYTLFNTRQKGLRRMVKDGDATAKDALAWLSLQSFVNPRILHWLERRRDQ